MDRMSCNTRKTISSRWRLIPTVGIILTISMLLTLCQADYPPPWYYMTTTIAPGSNPLIEALEMEQNIKNSSTTKRPISRSLEEAVGDVEPIKAFPNLDLDLEPPMTSTTSLPYAPVLPLIANIQGTLGIMRRAKNRFQSQDGSLKKSQEKKDREDTRQNLSKEMHDIRRKMPVYPKVIPDRMVLARDMSTQKVNPKLGNEIRNLYLSLMYNNGKTSF